MQVVKGGRGELGFSRATFCGLNKNTRAGQTIAYMKRAFALILSSIEVLDRTIEIAVLLFVL